MIVKWKVTKSVQIECPDYKPDPYTGEYPDFHCAVLHWAEKTWKKEKEFKTEKEADEFINNAPKECHDFIKI